VVEKTGSHRNSVNLKRRGTAPLVDVIRVHALAAGSMEQNSFARLDDLVASGWLTSSAVADLRDALEFISLVRIRHQARALEAGKPPTNNLNPEHLSSFERRSLKDAFQVLSHAQKFLKFRYRPVAKR
jgi:CBS domain-containing protein